MMPRPVAEILCSIVSSCLFVAMAFAGDPTAMLGFTARNAVNQRALEKKFDAQLDPAEQRAWLERMSAEPNHVGSTHNKANADFMLEQFREWGWDAKIETFYVLYPTPKTQALELVAPARFTARLHEPAVAGDRTSDKASDALPPYHAYGADGDVTADLVYVNQGMPDDYKELDRRGISVKGRIVIARYGGGWRGLKPKLAHEHGAIGCIIYSDPGDDGYSAGDVYPKGAYRPPEGVQRGSVADITIYSGDPLTPDVGATKDARRLSIQEARTVLKVPVMPISYADAQPLLAALGGPVAPADWRGALPITYHLGPGPARVHLAINSDWGLKPIYNVIATIPGSEHPDEWVIRGNHHDGWVFGAWDPLAANVVLMAEAKAIGALVKEGWKPKRTLVYASWDGEEPGLLGSTEWVETHADELRRKAILYVNSDTNGRGFLRAGGSHSLQTLVNQVAAGVRDPQTGATVLERLRAKMLVEGNEKGAAEENRKIGKRVAAGAAPPLQALGSGSDYTPFLQHLGIASLDLRYGGEDKDSGIYHSVYDSFDHYLRFGDPDFAYGVALAQTIGHVMLRVANADALPLRFSDFTDNVGQYVDELHKLADDLRERTDQQHRLLDEHAFNLAADPTETYLPPERESSVPFLNFAPLDNALLKLKQSTPTYDETCAKVVASDVKLQGAQLTRLNGLLRGMEQTLLHPQGLPGREWYRHMIYAPGMHTGYGVKTLPGVREAIEQRRWPEVEQYMTIIAGVLNAYSERLDEATAVMKQ
ncbi:MAG: folate hydrolase [Verrucomicrobia bacterium]|nr:MAG: folate hydrolase [Verrucomicrobiota bacterium]